MKKNNYKITKVVALAALLGTVFLAKESLAAEPTWGPERQTYTMEVPADIATFNSITDNPTLVDERKFVRVAHIPSDCDKSKIDYTSAIDGSNAPVPAVDSTKCILDFRQSVEIEPGEQYMVYIYYHNNASSTLNSVEGTRGVAKNVKLKSSFPELILGARGEVEANISYLKKHEDAQLGWDWDTEESSVWAKAYLLNSGRSQVALNYVAGSARHYNVGWQSSSGKILPLTGTHSSDPMVVDTKNVASTLFSDGVYLGFADGITPSSETYAFGNGWVLGCEPYHGIVTYVLQSAELKGEVEKQVSKDGSTFREAATIEPGSEVTYLIAVKNTGQKEMTHVVLDDTLPAGMTLVSGSVELRREGSSTWDRQNDAASYNLGTVGSGQIVYIRYKAKAGTNFDCAGTRITNTAKITYDGLSVDGLTDEDDAVVVVRKTGEECEDFDEVTLKKEASVNNGKSYKDAVDILPGETATFRLTIKNAGNSYIGHIDVEDALPEGLTLVENSAKIVYYDENDEKVEEHALTSLDIRIEVLAPGRSVQIIYDVRAGKDFDCKGKELTNTATITYGGENAEKETSAAKVTVKKTGEECEEPEINCKTNPEMEECKELPDTGPMEIAISAMIITGIVGGTGYLIMAKRKLSKMTADVMSEQSSEAVMPEHDKNDGIGMPNDGRQ